MDWKGGLEPPPWNLALKNVLRGYANPRALPLSSFRPSIILPFIDFDCADPLLMLRSSALMSHFARYFFVPFDPIAVGCTRWSGPEQDLTAASRSTFSTADQCAWRYVCPRYTF